MFELSAGRALRLMLGLRLQRIRNGFYPAKTESGRRRATPTVNRVGAVSSLLFGLAFIALMFFAELESQREAVEAGRGSEAFVIAVARGMLLANMFPFMFSMRPTELSDDIQWLLTLPIQARTLLVARGLEQALVNIFGVFFKKYM